MKKRMLLTIAAVSVVGAALLSGSYVQSQTDSGDSMYEPVRAMGGLNLVMSEAFAETSCSMDTTGRNVVEFNLTGQSVELPIMGGKTYQAMTFSGQVPGPTLRVTQGDVVKMTLAIPADENVPHGNDMHSSQMSSANFGAVNPGESRTYCYVAEVPGVFKYHCSGIDLAAMDQHVLSGMYGIAIVDPLNGYDELVVEKTAVVNGMVAVQQTTYPPDALEFQLQYNQLYLTDAGGYNMIAMLDHDTTATVVNGMQYGYVPNEVLNRAVNGEENRNIFVLQPWNGLDRKQYQSQPLYVETGQHVRIFVENQGNEPLFFHIVGEILDRVVQGGVLQSRATETWMLGGSQNMIVDVVFDEPGTYAAVNHDYAAIYSGAATVFVAGDPFGLNDSLIAAGIIDSPVPSYAYALGNPSDAVPPMGMNSIAHPMINLHGLYTDEAAAAKQREGAIPFQNLCSAIGLC